LPLAVGEKSGLFGRQHFYFEKREVGIMLASPLFFLAIKKGES
jgi:hypothetical protein